MLSKEDIKIIADLFKDNIKGVEDQLDKLETDVKDLENNVIPRLDKLEANVKVIKVDQLENNV
ncbi:hypothetical protein, partial [Butyrivibrio sp. VCB2006]|uniref:hypothetical protein n=1 Tax=Butyrivibrio sp. VCB2006 TaxID=1280679 RepID=UPI0004A3EF89